MATAAKTTDFCVWREMICWAVRRIVLLLEGMWCPHREKEGEGIAAEINKSLSLKPWQRMLRISRGSEGYQPVWLHRNEEALLVRSMKYRARLPRLQTESAVIRLEEGRVLACRPACSDGK